MGAARQPEWEEEQTEAEREEKAEEDEDNVRQGELRRKRDDDKMTDLLEQGQRQPEVQRQSETESYAAQQTAEEVAASQDATGPSQAHPEDVADGAAHNDQRGRDEPGPTGLPHREGVNSAGGTPHTPAPGQPVYAAVRSLGGKLTGSFCSTVCARSSRRSGSGRSGDDGERHGKTRRRKKTDKGRRLTPSAWPSC